MPNDIPIWATQSEAALALRTSERTLARMRANRILTVGLCWRRKNPNNKNSHCLYNLEACMDVLSGQAKAAELEQDLLTLSEKKEVVEG